MSVHSFKAWLQAKLDRLPASYRARPCQGGTWKQRFPSVGKVEIRTFLSVFVQAFGFAEGHRLRFSPDDRLLDIYRRMYPSRWQPDSLEFETLDRSLKTRYGLELNDVWRDGMTLGDLFVQTRTQGKVSV